MTPTPLTELRQHIERVQSSVTDPQERDRALGVVERDLTDMLGIVRTYRNDSRLQQEGATAANNNSDPESEPDGEADAAQTPPPNPG